jgi:hypothetical protein
MRSNAALCRRSTADSLNLAGYLVDGAVNLILRAEVVPIIG